MNIFASNVGNRAAIVQSARYQTNDLPSQPLVVTLTSTARLIEGGDTRSIELHTNPAVSPGGLVPFGEKEKDNCSVTITVESIAFDHEQTALPIVCNCPD